MTPNSQNISPILSNALRAALGIEVVQVDYSAFEKRIFDAYHCTVCKQPIPPGKEGRKCKDCRKGAE